MAESLYRDLLRITEEIEELLALDGYDERLTPLVTKRQDLFGRMADVPLDEKYAVLIKRIRATEDKCMAMTQDKLFKIKGDLLAMNHGKRAIAAYEKQV
ncbi:MAG: hypothetical protein KKD73_06940 [Proteobacteria bacterium]|nr:hypothetical protein [Pseudomonadota bacterium]MBU1638969.1 hypothetical protein [Pseudomonadota bacterium]